MPRLACRDLARRPFFEGQQVEVDEGEVVVLSGPSGSGKTLFLRALADLDPRDGGEVWLDGEASTSFAPERWRASVLYVHQSGVRLPGTVRANLDVIAALGVRDDSAPFPSVPGLEDGQDAERLSGGEAQALAIHRALCCRPRVLLLDEATSAMDPERAALWEARVRAYLDEGGSGLWVSHDPALAERLGGRRERFG